MRWIAVFAVSFYLSPAFALGLGEIEGRAIVGRPLQLAIPILGLAGEAGQGVCATLLTDGNEDGPGGIRIKVEGDRVHLSTSRNLTQPILQFRVRLGCSSHFERSFLVLPEPAGGAETSAASTLVAEPVPHRPMSQIGSAEDVRLPLSEPVPSAQRSIVLMSSTSLRMLSRQRYPANSRSRVNFIRQVAAANAELFSSEAAAYDQQLAAGTRLLLPAGLPLAQRTGTAAAGLGAARTPLPGAAPPRRADRPAAVARAPARPPAPRDRLIVGAAGMPAGKGPSAAELNESIDRLIEVMNQQVMVQIALTERIKSAEAELAELKRLAKAEKLRTAQLETEIKEVREAAERTGTIQLLLLILLGGLAGAWALSRLSKRQAPVVTPPAPAVAAAPAVSADQPATVVPQAFDNLFEAQDNREDILSPGTFR